MECLLCKDNEEGPWIKKHTYWNIHACWFQHTLGTIGIILKRHAEKFTELTSEEIIELEKLLKLLKTHLIKNFNRIGIIFNRMETGTTICIF